MLREVAVFDTINPGGFYAARVKPLGAYAAAAPVGPGGLPQCGDIADPLYGNSGGADEAERLQAAVAQLRSACRGLLAHLCQLHARYGTGTSQAKTKRKHHHKDRQLFNSEARVAKCAPV